MKLRNHEAHIISRIIESDSFLSIENPLLSSVLKFGSFPNILTILLFASNKNALNDAPLYAWLLGLIWLNIGPFLIWYYDRKALPDLFEGLGDVLDGEAIADLESKYGRKFRDISWTGVGFWVVISSGIFYASLEVFYIFGVNAQDTLTLIGIWIFYALFGFVWEMFPRNVAIVLARDLSEKELSIDIWHPDGRGGLSCLDTFIVRSVLVYSSGALVLPALYQISLGSPIDEYIYVIGASFTLFLIINFAYPILVIRDWSQKHIDIMIKESQQSIDDIDSRFEGFDDVPPIGESNEALQIEYLEFQRRRARHEDLSSVETVPLSSGIYGRFIAALFLPTVLTVLEIFASYLV